MDLRSSPIKSIQSSGLWIFGHPVSLSPTHHTVNSDLYCTSILYRTHSHTHQIVLYCTHKNWMSRDVLYFLYEAPPTPKKKKGGGELIESEYWPRKEKKKKREKKNWMDQSDSERKRNSDVRGGGTRAKKRTRQRAGQKPRNSWQESRTYVLWVNTDEKDDEREACRERIHPPHLSHCRVSRSDRWWTLLWSEIEQRKGWAESRF